MDLSMFIPVTTSGINTSNTYVFPHTYSLLKVRETKVLELEETLDFVKNQWLVRNWKLGLVSPERLQRSLVSLTKYAVGSS